MALAGPLQGWSGRPPGWWSCAWPRAGLIAVSVAPWPPPVDARDDHASAVITPSRPADVGDRPRRSGLVFRPQRARTWPPRPSPQVHL